VPALSADPLTQPQVDVWITLGTQAGPIADANRSQPANVLVSGGRTYLVDVGVGTAQQLARSGIPLSSVQGIFISHLHFDHTGGLAAILGLRYQTNNKDPLPIFGPPGTRELVVGLTQSMIPSAKAGYGIPGAAITDPASTVTVIELAGDDSFDVDVMNVRTVRNTHYSFEKDSEFDRRFRSLSFRFNTPERSIVYTGDTGPSSAVNELARDADLLVAEMMDVDRVIALVADQQRRLNPDPPNLEGVNRHLRAHHLSPEDVGEMAARAEVEAVVVTHIGAPRASAADLLGYIARIGTKYAGPVAIANDLDEF
jgi:ribonuclease BN (tRNA processing enzyme)